jgi:hypothetical protein
MNMTPKFLITTQHNKVLARWRVDSPNVNELTQDMRDRADANMRELIARGIAESGYYGLALRNGANELDYEDCIA